MFRLSILIFILTGLMSCKKDIKPYFNTVSQFEHDFVGFKAGTYWIYEDDSTSTVDSISIDHLYYAQYNRRNNDGDIVEYYDDVKSFCQIDGHYNSNYRFGVSEDYGFYAFENWNADFKFYNNSIIPYLTNDIVKYLDSVTVNNLIFYNVYELIQSNRLKTVDRVDLFTAQRIGVISFIIKYTDGHTESKKLKRYHIEP